MKILEIIIQGGSHSEVMEKLGLTKGTVKWHIENIYRRWEVHSKYQLIIKAHEKGLVFKKPVKDPEETGLPVGRVT